MNLKTYMSRLKYTIAKSEHNVFIGYGLDYDFEGAEELKGLINTNGSIPTYGVNVRLTSELPVYPSSTDVDK